MKKITISLFACFSLFLHAQYNIDEISFTTMSINDGLLSNETTCFLQDDIGFIWVGTTNGLCRYDGYEFKAYKSNYLNPKYFLGNSIKCLAKDTRSRLWIGTTIGINVLDLKTGLIVQYALEDLGCSVINTIALSHDNIPYIGTEIGVLRLNEETKVVENIKSDSRGVPIKGNYIQTLYVDRQNVLWIGTWHTGFSALDLNKNIFYQYPDIVEDNKLSITSIFEDNEGCIWLSSWNEIGLIRLENPYGKTPKTTTYPIRYKEQSSSIPSVFGAFQDHKNRYVWIATSDGLKVLTDINNPASVINYDVETVENITSNEMSSIYIDRTGIIWLSMSGMGICLVDLNKKQFNEYSFPELKQKKEIKTITSVYQDTKGWLWLGVKGNTLALFHPKTKKLYKYFEHPILKSISSQANAIMSFAEHKSREELWMTTRYYGTYVIRFKNNEIVAAEHLDESRLKSPNTTKVVVGAKDLIWISSIKGLNYYKKESENYVCHSDEMIDKVLNEMNINTIWYDGNETLWVGSQTDGLFKIQLNNQGIARTIESYSMSNNKINNNNILSIFKDSKNRLWIGTYGGGLSYYNKEKDCFSLIDNMTYMPDDAIFSIEEDESKNLWLSTGKGLVCYSPDSPSERQMKTFFNQNLRINSFCIGASEKDSSGNLFFGGNDGLIWFSPSRFKDNLITYTPVITDVYVNNKDVSKVDKKQKNEFIVAPYAKEIEIGYRDNSIRIEFASLSFEDPQSKSFTYMLEGIDDDWIVAGMNNRYAVYNNLKKGSYVFRVKSYNEDGYTTGQYAALKIIRLPAPWETNWAYSLYVIVFMGLVTLIFSFVFNRINLKHTLEMEHMERVKSEEVNQAKLQFFTNVSHELFTPMTVLSCSLDDLALQYPSNNVLINIMRQNLNRLTRLLQQILEFRKAETGNLKLKVSEGDLIGFIREICEISFFPLMKTKRLHLEIISEMDNLNGFFDPDKLDKIMYNLLSNAFKYNRYDGLVNVKIEEERSDEHRYAVIKVKDTGPGIEAHKIPNLFKRFYEGDYRKFKTKGTGIGLSLTRDLVRLHSGSISVESELGVGTQFSVRIPIDKTSYTEEQIDVSIETEEIVIDAAKALEIVRNSVSENEEDKDVTVLLAEDNLDLLKVMSDVLERDFNVVTAINGKEALFQLEDKSIDVLVTDYVMPKMDGIELCKRIKNDMNFSHIPIIMLTAKQAAEDKIQSFDAGADVYITKPFEISSLAANIKSLVRNRRNISAGFQAKDNIQLSEFTYNSVDEEFLNNAIRIVEENVKTSDFNATDFYLAMNMTQPTLYRKIKSLTNMSPNEFIRNIKFKLACKLLVERKLNVSETAYELGFVDPRYFSSVFKKEIGMSPSDYIKKHGEDMNKENS